jgi:hypothetical protein
MTIYTGRQPDFYEQGLEAHQISLDRALSTTWDQQWLVNPTTSIGRMWELQQARGRGTALTQEEALGIIEESGLKGHLDIKEHGITDKALNILMERKNNELKLQALSARGPTGHGFAHFGVGFAASVVDPLNIASAFVPVVGAARYASMLHKAGGAAGRFGVRAKVGAVEGLAGAVAVEIPVVLAARQEQSDYGMHEALLNIGFGVLLGGGLSSVGGRVVDSIKYGIRGKPGDFERIMFELDEAVPRTADEKIAARRSIEDSELKEKILHASIQEMSEEGRDILNRHLISAMIRNAPAEEVAKLIIDADIEADVGVRGFNRNQVRTQIKDNVRAIKDVILSKIEDKNVAKQVAKQLDALERRLTKDLQTTSHKEIAKRMKSSPKDVGKVMDKTNKTWQKARDDFEAVMDRLGRQIPELAVEIDNIKMAALMDEESFIMSPSKRANAIMQKLQNQKAHTLKVENAAKENLKPENNRLYDAANKMEAEGRLEQAKEPESLSEAEAEAVAAKEEWEARQVLDIDYKQFEGEIDEAIEAEQVADDLSEALEASSSCVNARG